MYREKKTFDMSYRKEFRSMNRRLDSHSLRESPPVLRMIFVNEQDGSVEVTPPYEKEMSLEEMKADTWSMVINVEDKSALYRV